MYSEGDCCLCGQGSGTRFCRACGHYFCRECRMNYFKRGYEAVMTLLGRSRLFCGGEHG